jgi:four helix bundle protein
MNYEDLEIYQIAYKLALNIHEIVADLPKTEQYGEGNQIKRSSKSIAANIAEGFGRRRYKKEFIKFLTYARASCDESIVHLNFLHDTKNIEKNIFKELKNEFNDLSRKIYKFTVSVEVVHNKFNYIPVPKITN